MTNANPQAALEALTTSSKLTLGKIAVLCRIDSPILGGVVVDVAKTLTALYVISHKLDDVLAAMPVIEERALLWGDTLSPTDYRTLVASALDSVAGFLAMLPRPEDGSGKDLGTAGSQSSSNGSAGPTATASDTSSTISQQSTQPFSGGVGPKVQVDLNQEP